MPRHPTQTTNAIFSRKNRPVQQDPAPPMHAITAHRLRAPSAALHNSRFAFRHALCAAAHTNVYPRFQKNLVKALVLLPLQLRGSRRGDVLSGHVPVCVFSVPVFVFPAVSVLFLWRLSVLFVHANAIFVRAGVPFFLSSAQQLRSDPRFSSVCLYAFELFAFRRICSSFLVSRWIPSLSLCLCSDVTVLIRIFLFVQP